MGRATITVIVNEHDTNKRTAFTIVAEEEDHWVAKQVFGSVLGSPEFHLTVRGDNVAWSRAETTDMISAAELVGMVNDGARLLVVCPLPEGGVKCTLMPAFELNENSPQPDKVITLALTALNEKLNEQGIDTIAEHTKPSN